MRLDGFLYQVRTISGSLTTLFYVLPFLKGRKKD